MKIQTLSAAEGREYPVAVVGGGIAGIPSPMVVTVSLSPRRRWGWRAARHTIFTGATMSA